MYSSGSRGKFVRVPVTAKPRLLSRIVTYTVAAVSRSRIRFARHMMS
jgi:hypothetical protein